MKIMFHHYFRGQHARELRLMQSEIAREEREREVEKRLQRILAMRDAIREVTHTA